MRTRRMIGLTLALVAAAAAPQAASAQSFEVRQCHPNNPSQPAVDLWVWHRTAQQYGLNFRCSELHDDNGLRIRVGGRTWRGEYGRTHWTLPAGLFFNRVVMHARLRRENGHRPEIYVISSSDVQATKHLIAVGESGPTGWRTINATVPGRDRFALELRCVNASECPQHDLARAQGRNFVFTIQDTQRPSVALHRTGLAAGGWRRGTETLTMSGTDVGSGIQVYGAAVNGTGIPPSGNLSCPGDRGGWAAVFVPCSLAPGARSANVPTTQAPFRDGQNMLRVCARDYSGLVNCDEATVMVDNTPPNAAFLAPDPTDPELIRVRVDDATSGVDGARSQIRFRREGSSAWSELEAELAGGELRGRVDSENAAPGKYEFEARVFDAAGNERTTSERVDGRPMVVSFPLREDVRLPYRLENGQQKATLAYNARRRIRGRLLNSSGEPIANSSVRIVERFVGRARPKRRATVRATNENGAFALKLNRGPSRRVRVEYAGNRRYRPLAPPRRLTLRVRGRARLAPVRRRVRPSERVPFRGRIGRRGAVLPNGGKLYELQVKAGPKRWITVGKARRSRPDGRFRATHRFGPQLRPTTFAFRVRVVGERGWGYLPVRSNVRRVTVRPRR